ncbi:MAG: hypothetical protein ACRDOU_06350 [Streptosporangiaceae bacterium]
MARLRIDQRRVTLCLSAIEKLEALHRNVSVPRTAVMAAREVPDGLAELRGRIAGIGWRGVGIGTGLPGVLMVGTIRDSYGLTFAVCRGHGPAVVLDLAGHTYNRIVVTVEDPGEIVSRLP